MPPPLPPQIISQWHSAETPINAGLRLSAAAVCNAKSLFPLILFFNLYSSSHVVSYAQLISFPLKCKLKAVSFIWYDNVDWQVSVGIEMKEVFTRLKEDNHAPITGSSVGARSSRPAFGPGSAGGSAGGGGSNAGSPGEGRGVTLSCNEPP